jgi:hypothetical protein
MEAILRLVSLSGPMVRALCRSPLGLTAAEIGAACRMGGSEVSRKANALILAGLAFRTKHVGGKSKWRYHATPKLAELWGAWVKHLEGGDGAEA